MAEPSNPAAPRKVSGYLPTLDGWRAVAIACVICSHQILRFPARAQDFMLTMGGRGVQIFFALSGLLICTRLLREEQAAGRISLRSFYLRRLWRIQPAALVYLAAVALLSLLGIIPTYWKGIAGALLMIRNLWPPTFGYAHWFTGHFWSLSVEEHFYLLLPATLLLIRRRRLVLLSLFAVALEVWYIQVMRHAQLRRFGYDIWFRTDINLNFILLGCIAALALTHPHVRATATRFLQPTLVLALTAALFWRLQVHRSTYDHIALVLIYPLMLVSTMLHPRSLIGRLLESPPMRFLGRISYSLYLWQELFFVADHPAAPGTLLSHLWFTLPASLGCAIASFYLVETPLIRIGHRFAGKPKPTAANPMTSAIA